MNTPALRVVGPSGSGRSAIAAALHKLLTENGVASEVISCAVDEQSWRLELRSMLRGKLLPIIVSPNRPGDDIPPTMELMKELAIARKSAQDSHKKCQQLEAQLRDAETLMQDMRQGNRMFGEGMRYASRLEADRSKNHRETLQKEFERKLAAYKDATRSEMKALRHGSVPDAFIASHICDTGKKSPPHILLSYHRPTEVEVRETCGYPTGGEVTCGPLIVPLIPPKAK